MLIINLFILLICNESYGFINRLVDCSKYFGVTSPDYRVFRLKDNRNNLNYFKYVMQCCYMNKIFYSLGRGVSNLGRWRLQTESFNNFKIPVPPYEEQQKNIKIS